MRILIAGDEARANKAICEYPHEVNNEVDAALDGQLARDAMDRDRYDLTVLDIMLSKITGGSVGV